MKILIVDDNEPLGEALKDLLTREGHSVREARTISEAIEKIRSFLPDVILLDSHLKGTSSIHFVDEAKVQLPETVLRFVLFKTVDQSIPSDLPEIRATIVKPFVTAQVLEVLKEVDPAKEEEENDPESQDKKVKKRPSHERVTPMAPPSEGDAEKHKVGFGNNYVIFEPYADTVYKFIAVFDPARYNIMVVTTDKAKAIKDRFSYGSIEVLPLSYVKRGKAISVKDLGTISFKVREFIEKNRSPVVVFDTFSDIISSVGLNQAFLMIQQICSGKARMSTVAIDMDPEGLSEKDRRIILHNMIKLTWED